MKQLNVGVVGAGVLRDYQVYYLTALISVLGPAKKVSAMIRTPYKKRVGVLPDTSVCGKEYETPNESIVTAFEEPVPVTGLKSFTLHCSIERRIRFSSDYIMKL